MGYQLIIKFSFLKSPRRDAGAFLLPKIERK
nr:MAG TPA: hypothetical protein [Caudoviricetes sp.]